MGRGNPLRLRIDAARIVAGVIDLEGGELHHLRVRHLGPGDAVLCFDDSGREWTGTVRSVSSRAARIELAAPVEPGRESPLHLVLAQAVLKGDHLDLVVEKTTELGVAEIVLFETERTVARPSAARVERLRRIAESAAKQSGRLRVPRVLGPVAFAEVLSPGAVVFHPGGPALAPARLPALTAIVGPEGGFSEVEVARADTAGCTLAGLGPRILRGETAAIVACALCQFVAGDLATS